MAGYYYDFHIHSCLSPCGDDDMTPNNIVNMAKLKGLDVIALTDHNSCLNCPAAVKAGQRAGLLVLPGMEICTREDIHCVCLFSSIGGALSFGSLVRSRMSGMKNRPDIFGRQLILDENDRAAGEEDLLLIRAADIGVDDLVGLTGNYGGAAFPAHADKPSNGIIATLGTLPPEAGFRAVELSPGCDEAAFYASVPSAAGLKGLLNSDAHYLWQISERENKLEFDQLDRSSIILWIRQEKLL